MFSWAGTLIEGGHDYISFGLDNKELHCLISVTVHKFYYRKYGRQQSRSSW